MRKVPAAVVSTWELASDTDEKTESLQFDEFLKEVFKNLWQKNNILGGNYGNSKVNQIWEHGCDVG